MGLETSETVPKLLILCGWQLVSMMLTATGYCSQRLAQRGDGLAVELGGDVAAGGEGVRAFEKGHFLMVVDEGDTCRLLARRSELQARERVHEVEVACQPRRETGRRLLPDGGRSWG